MITALLLTAAMDLNLDLTIKHDHGNYVSVRHLRAEHSRGRHLLLREHTRVPRQYRQTPVPPDDSSTAPEPNGGTAPAPLPPAPPPAPMPSGA